MEVRSADLVSLFEKALSGTHDPKLEEIGTVFQVGDGMCRAYGLTRAMYGELIEFEGGNQGIVFSLEENFVSIFLLFAGIPVLESEVAKRTGQVFKAPVGPGLLGRVINATGKPLDGLGEIASHAHHPVEAVIPGVIDRTPINEPLQTGVLAVDALVPIGKGQRELIIGNRNTGKTAMAIDTIINQKGQNVYCVYVSIGQRQANLARIVNYLQENGALEYTVIISADASDPVLNQYLAPYVGCTIAEDFMNRGADALIIYDDLTNHAIAYREMSLLLKRSPGREAYPGDVFYLHSRLLERAGALRNGGSLTALPIVQLQGDDITAYIPTNLISITDGQVFLDTSLFNKGIRPAVNVGLSVSRVGGAAQTKAIKQVTKALRLELAQYHDLLDFAQFGSELDEISQRRLARGGVIVQLLIQERGQLYSFVDQALMLYLLRENLLDGIALGQVRDFACMFTDYVHSVYSDTYNTIAKEKAFSDEALNALPSIVQEFKKIFLSPTE